MFGRTPPYELSTGSFLKLFSHASYQRASTVTLFLEPAPWGSPTLERESVPAQIEIAWSGSLSGLGIAICSPSLLKVLNECHPNMFLNCLRGFCSLILENTRSQPFLCAIYLNAEHKSFFYTGSFYYAKRSYFAPITVIGTMQILSYYFSFWAGTVFQYWLILFCTSRNFSIFAFCNSLSALSQ